MNKKGQTKVTPKLVGKWIGLIILCIGVFLLIMNILTQTWDKTWIGIIIGIVGVVVMLISNKWL